MGTLPKEASLYTLKFHAVKAVLIKMINGEEYCWIIFSGSIKNDYLKMNCITLAWIEIVRNEKKSY